MSKEDNGGPAFPPVHDPKNHPSGMTLRDWFAGQALIHIQAADKDGIMGPEITAFACYRLADAMIEARKK